MDEEARRLRRIGSIKEIAFTHRSAAQPRAIRPLIIRLRGTDALEFAARDVWTHLKLV